MGSSDSVISRFFPVLVLAALALLGWWAFLRGGEHPAVPQPPAGVLAVPSSAGPFLLQPSQIGAAYVQSAEQTRKTTDAEIRDRQSAAALQVINASWKAGAWAGWYQANGSITALSRAEVFKVSGLSVVSAGFEKRAIRQYHGKPTALPSGVPGDGGWFVTGSTISPTYSSQFPALRQVAVYGWQHGDVLAVITVTGLPRDDVGEIAAALARAQDQNIGYAAG
jgi:hypothetical protein